MPFQETTHSLYISCSWVGVAVHTGIHYSNVLVRKCTQQMNSEDIVLRCKIDRHAMLRTVTKQFTLHNVLVDILSMTCVQLSWAAWEESHWGLRRGRLKLAVCGELIDGQDPAHPLPLCCWGNWWEVVPDSGTTSHQWRPKFLVSRCKWWLNASNCLWLRWQWQSGGMEPPAH